MAAVIGRTQGFAKNGSAKAGEATRLGHSYVRSEANTWRTFVSVVTHADGTVDIAIRRDGSIVARIALTEEDRSRFLSVTAPDDVTIALDGDAPVQPAKPLQIIG